MDSRLNSMIRRGLIPRGSLIPIANSRHESTNDVSYYDGAVTQAPRVDTISSPKKGKRIKRRTTGMSVQHGSAE